MEFSEKYVKKRMLGKGSRAVVWLVENIHIGTTAAMKLYTEKGDETEREIGVLKKMGGKGVPYLIDCVEEGDSIGIIMEYVEGKSLRNLMEEQKVWSEEKAIETAMQTAKILSGFHRQVPAMIYADLKPENIMVTPAGEVYLVDFGSVIFEGEREKRLFGTKAYLPPSEEDKVTPYRDTYGLGVILYEMLTGCRMSDGIENGKADISHLSSECRQIMQRAVRICAAEGYMDAGEMYEALKKCKEALEEGKAGRRKKKKAWNSKKRKRNYFICDLKRVLLYGHIRMWGIFCVCLMMGCFLLNGRETKAAGTRGDFTDEEAATETEYEEKEKYTDREESPDDGVIRDEYGRKLVIRKTGG